MVQRTLANRNSNVDIPPHNNVAVWSDGIDKQFAPQPNVTIPIVSPVINERKFKVDNDFAFNFRIFPKTLYRPPLKLLLTRLVKPVTKFALLESNTAIKFSLRIFMAREKSISPDILDIELKNPKFGKALPIWNK